ncbi:MAG: hypothetical protein ACRDK3_06090 [Actinomycetota bacterium]
MKAISLVMMVVLSVFAACAESPPDEPSAESPEESAVKPEAGGMLLSFQRSGGFAGMTEMLTIQSDGRARLDSERVPSARWEVPPELMDRLRTELAELDWARAGSEPRDITCNDCFSYRIQSGAQRVTTTGLGESGEELGDLLALVEEIIASSSNR